MLTPAYPPGQQQQQHKKATGSFGDMLRSFPTPPPDYDSDPLAAIDAVDSFLAMDDDDEFPAPDGTAAAICECCEEAQPELFFCNACSCILCNRCWRIQLPHRKSNAAGVVPHEKTELGLAQRIQDVFLTSADEAAFKRMHIEDQNALWVGIGHIGSQRADLRLRDYGRYSDLMCETDLISPESCHPGLVSFVGQTGAGKSTLVKLLIKSAAPLKNNENLSYPVAGARGRELPTSADIHLYADPHSILSTCPVLYADCEGLDGGTREPLAALLMRRPRYSVASAMMAQLAETSEVPSERRITWADDDVKRSRGFVVSQLYPRILFAFSDVVVFVHRNPRTVEGVLDKLMEWAAAVETSSNQPVLPCAVLVLNFCENDSNPSLWDVDAATSALLESLAETIDKNPSFKKYAALWRSRGKDISSVQDLLSCYYSSFRTVRIPADGRPRLMHDQALKLHHEIQQGVSVAQERKMKLRMLLNAIDFQTCFQQALDHFCDYIDQPFDYVQSSFSNHRLSSEVSQNILALAILLKESARRPDAVVLWDNLSYFLASCIMLHAIRNNIKGTADRLVSKFAGQIDAALTEFCYKHWPCEFFEMDTSPQTLQANWDNSFFFAPSASQQCVRFQCANVRVGHGTRDHRLKNGRYFAAGEYTAKFSVESHRTRILNNVFYHLHELLNRVTGERATGANQLDMAIRIHKEEVNRTFFSANVKKHFPGFENTTFCISCLFRPANYTVFCGDSLCRDCVKAYGRAKSSTSIEIDACPLHASSTVKLRKPTIYLKPEEAGIRILSLDDGGVNSIVQVEILKMLENQFGGKLSLQCLFDLVVGEGTGGVLALGLASKGWGAHDCEEALYTLLEQSFSKSIRRLPNFSFRKKQFSSWKYHSRPLEDLLKKVFPEPQRIIDQDYLSRSDYGVHVAVRSRSVRGYPVVFSNYPSTKTHTDVKLWEGARATMSNRAFFKPFNHVKLGPLSIDHARDSVDTVSIAAEKLELTFGEQCRPMVDAVLSVGGLRYPKDANTAVAEGKAQEENELQDILENSQAQALETATMRFQIQVDEVPAFDDLSSIGHVQRVVRHYISPRDIRRVAARLFATLFYVEENHSVHEVRDYGFVVHIQVLCRLPDESPEIYKIGELFRKGTFSNLAFIFREEGEHAQRMEICLAQIELDLISGRPFSIPMIRLRLRDKYARVFAAIRLEDGDEYTLSGFPKPLVRDNKTLSVGAASENEIGTPSVLSVPWIAPGLSHNRPLTRMSINSNLTHRS